MLENWQVERFKSIVDPYDFALADLTLLTGLNNTGKSSLLQSIVLIAQSLSSHSGKEQLLFQGPMLDLGTAREIANDSTSTPLTFHFTLGPSLPNAYMPIAHSPREWSYLHAAGAGVLPDHSLEVTLNVALVPFHRDTHDIQSMGTASKFVKDALPLVKSLKIVVDAASDGDQQIVFSAKSTLQERGRTYQELLNPSYQGYLEFNGQRVNSVQPLSFVRFLPDNLKLAFPVSSSRVSSRHSTSGSPLAASLEYVEKAIAEIKHFFSKGVAYLGVPRSYAPMSAPLNGLDDYVGEHGEYAASVYGKHCNKQVDWYDPIKHEKKYSSLAKAVDCWLQYLEVACSVEVEGMGLKNRDGFRWKVEHRKHQGLRSLSSGSPAVNQVLPLLVMGLLAPTGSLLLVEQPELCLHQRAQARLGDFFVSLAQYGKQCLIETQSENLVTQLRYHIVREGGHDPDKYMIYFAGKDDEAKIQLKSIEISPRGNILNWPEGFFDETSLQEEHMGLAYLRRKAQEASEEQPHR